MTERKFYRTVVQIEVLSEEPYEGEDLDTILYDITEGHCSGRVTDVVRNEIKTGEEMAKLLDAQDSDPEFFDINERGEDLEDQLEPDENPEGVEAVCEVCKAPCEYDGEVCLCKECLKRGTKRPRPRIICICGSSRFAELHAVLKWELEKRGVVAMSISVLPEWYAETQGWNTSDHFGEASGTKDLLDDLHLRKIEMANGVIVVNLNGYIGDSTAAEIKHAEKLGKPVAYFESCGAAEDEEDQDTITQAIVATKKAVDKLRWTGWRREWP